MTHTKDRTTKQELSSLCQARREAIQDLENHRHKPGGSEILAQKLEHHIIRALEEEIADKLETWLAAARPKKTGNKT